MTIFDLLTSKSEKCELLNTLIQESKDGILLLDQEGVVQYSNRVAQELFSPQIKDLIGYSFGIPAIHNPVDISFRCENLRTLKLSVIETTLNGEPIFLTFVNDVTEIQEIQQKLQVSETRYHQIFEFYINAFILFNIIRDEGGQIVDFIYADVNHAFESLVSISREMLIGKSANKFFSGRINSSLSKMASEVIETGKTQLIEFYSDFFDRTFLISAFAPVPGQLALVLQDITERLHAEKVLENSERRFRQLFEHSINGFALNEIILDDQGTPVDFRYLVVNAAFEDNTGVKPEDAIGRLSTEVFPGIESSGLIEIYGKVALTMEPVQFEIYFEPLERHYVITAYAPEHGQFAMIFQDVTERVLAENTIKASETKYRLLFENAITGFTLQEVVFDENGKPLDLIFLEVNEAFERHTGLKAKDVLGKRVKEVSPQTEIIDLYGRIVKTGKAETIEYQSPNLLRTFLISAYSPAEGQVASIFYDISDQIETARELRTSEEKFRTLYETMAQGVIYQNAKGEIISANPAAEHILGKSLSQLMGKNYSDSVWKSIKLNGEILLAEDHPGRAVLRTGTPIEGFILGVFNPKRKEYLWIDVSVIPQFREGEEQPYQVFTTFLDVTDTIRVQKALEERIKELRCLSEVSSILQEKQSLDEVCQDVIDRIVPAMQYPESAVVKIEMAGKIFQTAPQPEMPVQFLKAPINIRDENYGSITVFYNNDRSFILPEELNLLESIAERLALWYQQNQTKEQLEESEKRLRNAIMDAPNPIMIHAFDGEIIFINDAWIESSGYSRDEIQTMSDWLDNAHPDRRAEISELAKENYVSNFKSHKGGYPIQTKDGRTLQWYFSTAVLGKLPDDREIVITIAIDITDQILAERDKQLFYNRLNALREIDQVIVSTLDLDQVLTLITSHMSNVITFDSMAILLIDGENLNVIACQGFEKPDEIINLSFPSTPDFPNYNVIENMTPATYVNVSDDFPLFYQPVDMGLSGEIKSWLGVPLINQGRVIGMFTIDRIEEQAYTEEDVEIAMQFANRAAIAITNAQLFEQTKSQLEQLEILRVIDGTITSEMSLRGSLKIICEQISIGLNVDVVSVFLYDEDEEVLTFAQGYGMRTKGNPEVRVNLGHGYIGTVALKRAPLFIPEVDLFDTGGKFPFSFIEEGVVSYYGFPLIAKGKLTGVMQILQRSTLDPDQVWCDFAETLAGQTAIAVDNLTLVNNLEAANEELIEAYEATIEGWAHALEIRDKETEGHSRRVDKLTVEVCRRFGFSEAELVNIRRGVLLHDIGKMGIPDQILRKPGPLDEDEWVIMRMHPVYAYEMLKDIEYLRPALKIPHSHHERWDGSGYPEGLKGEAIPLEARIFAVADVWDALTSDRPYRKAWSREKAKQYLLDKVGIEFDPNVVTVFLEAESDEEG